MAERLLGGGHPLVALLYACQATTEAIVAVAALQFAALALLLLGTRSGLALAASGAVVQLTLDLRLAVLPAHQRELCLELIIAGRERLPLAAVARERRRLLEPRHQRRLARSMEEPADIAARRRHEGGRGRPLHSLLVLVAVEPQLRELADLLRADGAGVRGVALVEYLITTGVSSLYGERVGPLRDELGRARHLLGSAV